MSPRKPSISYGEWETLVASIIKIDEISEIISENKDDICERYLSILQLRILLEEKFITLIDKDGFKITPHAVVTGLKGDVKLLRVSVSMNPLYYMSLKINGFLWHYQINRIF